MKVTIVDLVWLFRKMKLPYPQDWVLSEKLCEELEENWWDKESEQDFDIESVGSQISSWLEQ